MNKHWRFDKVGNALSKLKKAARVDSINRSTPSRTDLQSGTMSILLPHRSLSPKMLNMQQRQSSSNAQQTEPATTEVINTKGNTSASVAAAHIFSKSHSIHGSGVGVAGSMNERERMKFITYPTCAKSIAREISESIQDDLMPINNDTKHLLALMNHKSVFDAGSPIVMKTLRPNPSQRVGWGRLRTISKFPKAVTSARSVRTAQVPARGHSSSTDSTWTIGQANWHQPVKNLEFRMGPRRSKQSVSTMEALKERKKQNAKQQNLNDNVVNTRDKTSIGGHDYKQFLRFDPNAMGKPKRFDDIYLNKGDKPMGAMSASQQLIAQNVKPNPVQIIKPEQVAPVVKKRLSYIDIMADKTIEKKSKPDKKKSKDKIVQHESRPWLERLGVTQELKKFMAAKAIPTIRDKQFDSKVKKSKTAIYSSPLTVPFIQPTKHSHVRTNVSHASNLNINSAKYSSHKYVNSRNEPKAKQAKKNSNQDAVQSSKLASSRSNSSEASATKLNDYFANM